MSASSIMLYFFANTPLGELGRHRPGEAGAGGSGSGPSTTGGHGRPIPSLTEERFGGPGGGGAIHLGAAGPLVITGAMEVKGGSSDFRVAGDGVVTIVGSHVLVSPVATINGSQLLSYQYLEQRGQLAPEDFLLVGGGGGGGSGGFGEER